MKVFKRFILMLQFLTAIPLPVTLEADNEEFGKGLILAPVVGAVLGGLLAAAGWLLGFIFPLYIICVFIIVLYMLLTGGLHLDGLGDTFDGLFSNRSKERMLEIMRDSRVGTNAVLAISCVLLLNVVLLSGFAGAEFFRILFLMPVAGRIGSLVSAGVSTYARSGEGLGKSFIDYCGRREILIGVTMALVLFFAVKGGLGLILALFSVLTAFLFVKFFSRKIGGATGDILGAVCELNQTAFLIFAFIINSIGR